MIELPEAITLAKQINKVVKGNIISSVIAGAAEHKLVWYYGDKNSYQNQLKSKSITSAANHGGLVEVSAENMKILFGDGVNLRFLKSASEIPKKHQLLIEFSNNTYLCGSVQMYGGLGCFEENTLDNEYYKAAVIKPSPLSGKFTEKYFKLIVNDEKTQKLSVKGLLATEQRIPGLGNGILQDILFNAKLHPKKKVNTLSEKQIQDLFISIKNTIKKMTDDNGRDTEKDLFGIPGKYKTILCKNTVGKPCPECNTIIEKTGYMGGSIYFCPECQLQ